MAKFRIRLKLQALELEVDGEREDIPAITAAVQQQFAGLIQPAETMADGNKQLPAGDQTLDAEVGKTKGRGKKRGASKVSLEVAQPIEFRHDSEKYGSPQQAWNITDKCIWMIYVLNGSADTKEVTGPQLAATFNHHFKAAGAIHPPLATRELAKAKIKSPALVGEDKAHDPSLWYLTDEGKKYAQQLVQNSQSA